MTLYLSAPQNLLYFSLLCLHFLSDFFYFVYQRGTAIVRGRPRRYLRCQGVTAGRRCKVSRMILLLNPYPAVCAGTPRQYWKNY